MPNGDHHAVHGGDFFQAIGEEFGELWRSREVISADVLDAWYDPAPGVLESLNEHLPWLVKTSPPTHGEGLVRVISKARQIHSDCLAIGSGSSSLSYLALPRLLSPGSKAVILDPTYGEYAHLFGNVLGLDLHRVALDPEREFMPDVEEITQAAEGASIVILVNPNSPTGVSMSKGNLVKLLGSLGKDTLLWLDETYVDFDPDCPTLEQMAAEDKRLIVSKSMSKYYALSGMRVGYLACHPAVARQFRELSPPWSVGLLAQVAAVRALEDPGYYRTTAEATAANREELTRGLAAIPGVRPFRSVANFILMRLEGVTSAALTESTAKRGVFLRDCDSLSEWFGGRYVRTAVKDRESNRRIVDAIREGIEG